MAEQIIQEQLAERIKRARLEAGLSTEALARKLEVSVRTVASWQSGRSRPGYARLAALAQAVDKPVTWFFEKEGEASG